MPWWSCIVAFVAVLGCHGSAPKLERAQAATPKRQPSGSLVGSWHLNETSGTTAHDSSGHRHHGAIVGSVRLGVRGKFNSAYRFIPRSAVIVRDAPDLHPGRVRVTVSYWVKLITPPPASITD